MKAKSTFLVRKALASPTLVRGRLRGQGSVLPTPVHSRNISLNKLVIRWMSAKEWLPRKGQWHACARNYNGGRYRGDCWGSAPRCREPQLRCKED